MKMIPSQQFSVSYKKDLDYGVPVFYGKTYDIPVL